MKKLFIILSLFCFASAAFAETASAKDYEITTVREGNKTITTKTFADGSKEVTTTTTSRKGSSRNSEPSSYWNFGKPKFDSYGFGQNAVR